MKLTKTDAAEGVQPESLKGIGRRLNHWRKRRERGEHIPGVLWAAAVRMARKLGAQHVAQHLRPDYTALSGRLERARTSAAEDSGARPPVRGTALLITE